MNLYYDSEFTGLHQNTTFISLALVAEDGHAFYAEFTDYDAGQCDDWIRDNVLAHTRWLNRPGAETGLWREPPLTLCHGNKAAVRDALAQWLAQYDSIRIWADCPAWDWVLFCELFGGALHIPDNIHYLPLDLATLFKARGYDPDIDREGFAGQSFAGEARGKKHNALYDARLLMACHKKLEDGMA